MARLPIVTAPDPRLKVRSEPVETVDAALRRFMDDMLETMYDAPGIGLSAVQVGVPRRVIVIDVAGEGEPPQPLRMVNPEIRRRGDQLVTYEEGCLSLPEQYADVTRPGSVVVGYIDENNQPRELEAEGLLATCIQHEMDHLEGILFVDHLSAVRRSIILRKLIKARKAKALKSA